MKYLIRKEQDVSYYRVVLADSFSLPDLEECYREILDHPDWHADTDILWDARQCVFDHLTSNDLHAIGHMTMRYKDKRGRGFAAWVVSREIDFGISRMFQMMQEGRVIYDFRVFKAIQEAEKYLQRKTAHSAPR